MNRFAIVAFVAACSAPAYPGPASSPACGDVAHHVMAIGPVDRWIAEGRDDGTLPVDHATDREGVERFFEVACQENWPVAVRRCMVAQPTWAAVERECSDNKVWWYQPR